ncbi:MAG TPA: M15 family metallopeptidase [Candidatus Binatia bacterium]|nr:M15 family metallopeptidase [Candidatus Binatia bacterium]
MKATRQYAHRVRAALRDLGIDTAVPERRALALHMEAPRLACAGIGTDGRDKFLAVPAARAWRTLAARAARDGVQLQLISGFRSLEFQVALIRGKLQRGLSLDEILRVNAPPGYSEHHTGCALDIGTPGCAPLEEAFEQTPAFAWLQGNAWALGFSLSYPRDNAEGYLYEPWHWRWRPRR